MRILFTTIRNVSHFLPLVPFVSACLRRGHEVAVAAPQDLESRVVATGAAFFPFGHPGDAGLGPLWMRLRGASQEELSNIVIGEIFAGACASAALPGLIETVQQWKPAIVVRESMEFASVVATEKLGIPHVRVAIIASGAEADSLPIAIPPVDALGRSAGLPADASGERLLQEPALTLFPASFDTVAIGSAPVYRFKAIRKQASASALPDWWRAQTGPLVYLTLGTVAGGIEEAHAGYRTALDAVSTLPIRVLLTIGSELSLDVLGEVPSNVHVERFVPQDDVLSHAAAVICHGGSGTVLGTLAAGVPQVVTPMFADQPHNAERVAAIGAGLALPTRNTSVADLRGALTRVLHEPAFRTAAQRIAAEMAALPAVDDAALQIERLART